MTTVSGASDLPVRRVDFGWFVRPASDGAPAEAIACLGYLIGRPDGWVLVDTGLGSDPDVDAHYRPQRRSLERALADAGVRVDEVRTVVNCHLHFDHCGDNPRFAGRPIVVQRRELDAARHEADYTLVELVDAPGLRYEVLDGEAEISSGITVVPTPGHTAGHQSLVVRRGDGTVVVVAGQAVERAADWSRAVLARRALTHGGYEELAVDHEWLALLDRLDPRRVVFAHDHAVWEP